MIVDDHPVIREGIRTMLGQQADLAVSIGVASNEDVTAVLEKSKVDLVLLDIALRFANGSTLIQQIRKSHPMLPVLVLSAEDEDRFAEKAIRDGAQGYVMKSEPMESILLAVRTVLAGEIYLSPRIAPRIIQRMLRKENGHPLEIEEILSARELEIFALIGKGLETDAMARQLFVSPKTIRAHRNNIMRKLKLRGAIQLHQASFRWVHAMQSDNEIQMGAPGVAHYLVRRSS